MISTLIVMLSDSDSTTVAVGYLTRTKRVEVSMSCLTYSLLKQVSWEALARVIGSVPKEVLPSYIKLVRDAVSTARDKERRKRKVNFVLSYY